MTQSTRRPGRRPRAGLQARRPFGRRPGPRGHGCGAGDAHPTGTRRGAGQGAVRRSRPRATRRSWRSRSGPRRRRSRGRCSSASPTSISSGRTGGSSCGATTGCSRSATSPSRPRPGPMSSSTTCRATCGTVEVRLVGSDPAVITAPGPPGGRRPGVGRHPARSHAPDPGRRRGRSVSRDRAQLPARRRAVRRQAGASTARRRSARTAARGTSSSSRATCRPTLPTLADPGHRPAALERRSAR